VLKQFLDNILLAQSRKSTAARMNRSVFPESNHSLCERSNGLGLGQGGLDTLMFDQRTNLIRQECLPVLSGATKLNRFLLMSHRRAEGDSLSVLLFASGPLDPAPSPLSGVSIKPGSNFMPRLKPRCCSLSLISFSDFLPKLRYFSISASVFWASCPTLVMFALFKQFAARTLSSISFTLMLRSFFSLIFSSLTPAGV